MVLSVNGLTKAFGGLLAANDVSFDIEKNKIVGLIGPNGAGKTTLFNLISGTIPADKGSIVLNSHDISRKKIHQRTALGFARTFQGNRIFSNLTVMENLMISRHYRTALSTWKAILRPSLNLRTENENSITCRKILEFIGILHLENELAGSLPFAHRCLVSIANALATEPILLCLDEPIAGMNQTEAENMVKLIRRIKDSGITVLLVEHNMRAIMAICDHIVVLNYGRVLAEGTPKEIIANPSVIEAYLGGAAYA